MKTIVFIGTHKSGSSREAVRAAQRLGFMTVVFTNNQNFINKRTEFPDVHLMRFADLDNPGALREGIQRIARNGLQIMGILSFIDPYVHTAAALADEYGVNRLSTDAIRQMEDKILSRDALASTSYAPFFTVCQIQEQTDLDLQANMQLPLMVKSPLSSGSKDVIKANTKEELEESIQSLAKKYPKYPILLEEYLEGTQYLVETIVYQGEAHIIAVFEQEIINFGRFIVVGYDLLLDMSDTFYQGIQEAVEGIVWAHGMRTGACHLEMRHTARGWKLVEINPRISGGAMNRMVEVAYGINLVEQTLKMALGEKPCLEKKHEKHVFTRYLVVSQKGTLQKVVGKKRAFQCPNVAEVYIKPRKGTYLRPPLSMGHRYGYVIATGESSEDAKWNADGAAMHITFHLN